MGVQSNLVPPGELRVLLRAPLPPHTSLLPTRHCPAVC